MRQGTGMDREEATREGRRDWQDCSMGCECGPGGCGGLEEEVECVWRREAGTLL